MKKHAGRWTLGAEALLFAISLAVTAAAQDQGTAGSTKEQTAQSGSQTQTQKFAAGQRATIQGTVTRRDADSITVRTFTGSTVLVDITGNTKVRERKNNPFRRARNYAITQLLPGLDVEVKGRGASNGSVEADEIRFTQDDLRIAALMDTRVSPLENRQNESEQNQMRISGQVSELSAVSNAARGGAKAAQDTADTALDSAQKANASAESAKAGVRAANDRITSLDDYDTRDTVTVNFKVNSAVLTPQAKEVLDKLVEEAKNEKGYVVEVAGFASAEGNPEFNRELSQRRADAVIRYLTENHQIPLRRFITPFGYGSLEPVGNNHTRTGRQQNRRVEVRILVSKGLSPVVSTTAASH